MPFAASHSREPDVGQAAADVCQEVRSSLDGMPPDLCFLFVSHDHAEYFDELPAMVSAASGTRVLVGCTGETVIGGRDEIESGPAVSLWGAIFPDGDVEAFHVEFAQTADGIVCSGLPGHEGEGRERPRAVFLLGEPFTTAPQSVVARLSDEMPAVPLFGGMASGAAAPGENRLFLNSESLTSGAVGVVLRGGPAIRSVVSQGCRPIGKHSIITKAEGNVVGEIGGQPPLKVLQQLLPTLSPRDQALLRKGLHLGLVINEYQDSFGRGDFLISNVIGADQDTGAIAIGNRVRVGQSVQFHVRDAETADEDLLELLEEQRQAHPRPVKAGLLFSCNGRGTRLFARPNHDALAVQNEVGPIPLAGFFAQGELGPVGGKNYLHGFTASIVLFE